MKNLIHQYVKVLVMGFILCIHIAIGFFAKFFLYGTHRRAFQISMLQRYSRVCLQVVGVDLVIEGDHNWRPGQPYLVVSNHLSYLDTLLFASYKGVCFVSTVEVRETPFLGQVAEASGALFVERRSRENIREEIGAMEKVLKTGFSLAFFPEGTSTNGSSVLEFKRPLFAPAQRAGVPILPIVVQPEEINGEKITSANRDSLCWYGAMEFTPHFFALAGLRSLKITLKVLPEITANEDISRDILAEQSHAAIVQNFRPIA